ncbi:MAG TPA: hypothetical protein VEC12_05415 [Bacteroidia bacterium]|nr:hypothetical protein [Bacteroidia bacterium]
MKPDRVFFSASASISGNQVTITGAFKPTDVGKTLVLYNSIPTDFPLDRTWGPYPTYQDLVDVGVAAHVPYRPYKVNDTGRFWMWENSCGSFFELKQYETIAVSITKYIDANSVETDYTFAVSLSSLDAVMGTDNFNTFQDTVDYCVDNKLDLCIPDGDYLILFSDKADEFKQGIRLGKGDSSSITITGESKEKARLFYEYKTEVIGRVDGLGFYNTVVANDHYVRINTLQVVAPGYLPKLRGNLLLAIVGADPTAVNTHGFFMNNAHLELNSVIIEGGELKNMTVAVGFDANTGSPSNITPCYLTITDSYITRCYAIAISNQGDRPVLNVSDTTLYNIGLEGGGIEFCRSVGGTVYIDKQTTYSLRNVIFDTCIRHAFQMEGSVPYTKPTFYQELINCKFFNSGTVHTDSDYENTKILGCEINDGTTIIAFNSCLIANTIFMNSTSAGIEARSGITMDLIVADCRFIRKPAFTFGSAVDAPFLTLTFDNCLFEGETGAFTITFITMYGKQSLVVRNSSVIKNAYKFLDIYNETKALLENNTFKLVSSQENITLDGDDIELSLINNRFLESKPIRITGTYTHGGQITGYGNYFKFLVAFNNVPAGSVPPYFQMLLGRQGYYPNTILMLTTNSFLSQVNFNFDFYKLDRDPEDNPGTPVEVKYIAFNNLSSYSSTGIGIFCGLIRIMAVHDSSALGDIIIKNNTTLANGNIITGTGSDYTMKQYEVIEFYYDSNTQFWSMVR